MSVLALKWLHIVSAFLLVGTGFGSAFYKYMADRAGALPAIAHTNRVVVLADWFFTAPTVIVQPVTGVLLVNVMGYSLTSPWLIGVYGLYVLAGACWLRVVWLQIRMKRDSEQALTQGTPLPVRYWQDARLWFWLGIPAFAAMLAILGLMVVRPG